MQRSPRNGQPVITTTRYFGHTVTTGSLFWSEQELSRLFSNLKNPLM